MILDSITELKASKLVETPEDGEDYQLRSTEYGDIMSKVRDFTPGSPCGSSCLHSSTSSRIRSAKSPALNQCELSLQR